MDEPSPIHPRPCSLPHSAPTAWLKDDRGIEPPASDAVGPEPEDLSPEQQRHEEIDAFLTAYERIAPEAERRDGWTPFLRKLFLQVIAETGKVTLACEWTGMSRSSAYALAGRDRVFAAGWDAAAHMRRRVIEDDTFEKGLGGITETITRSDGVVITRHRYDSRLSIAVLNRLDRRCDRAEERGSAHLAAVHNWDEYLRLVGDGNDQAAEVLLDRPVQSGAEGAPDRPTCPLPERAFPIPLPKPPGFEDSENCWKNDDGTWMTAFAPPPGFDGYENVPWDGMAWYERSCTPEEAELLDAHEAAIAAAEQAELKAGAEAERDGFFAALRCDISTAQLASTGQRAAGNAG